MIDYLWGFQLGPKSVRLIATWLRAERADLRIWGIQIGRRWSLQIVRKVPTANDEDPTLDDAQIDAMPRRP